MKRHVYVCDVCGAEQQRANHWWTVVAFYHNQGGHVLQLGRIGMLEGDKVSDVCGLECLFKKVSEFADQEIRRGSAPEEPLA
jgi:hypothetical protein